MSDTKSNTRKIRSSVFAWFQGKNEAEIKAITKSEFMAFVLAVDPNWGIAQDEKKVGIHLSWYKSNYKKPATQEMLAKRAAAAAAQPAA